MGYSNRPAAGGSYRSWSSYGAKALEDMARMKKAHRARGFRVALRRSK